MGILDSLLGKGGNAQFMPPSYNAYLNPPPNSWNGNQFVVGGAPTGMPATQPPAMPAATPARGSGRPLGEQIIGDILSNIGNPEWTASVENSLGGSLSGLRDKLTPAATAGGQGMSEALSRMGAGGGGGGGGYDPKQGRQWQTQPPPQQAESSGGMSSAIYNKMPLLLQAIMGGGTQGGTNDAIGGMLPMLAQGMKSGEGPGGGIGTFLAQLFSGKEGALNSGFRTTPDGSPLGYYVNR